MTSRSEIRRLPERGSYDRTTIYQILDEALICHVGFNDSDGRPTVIPTIHARVGDVLYLHGSPASRMLRTVGGGAPVAVTATLVDGLVLARSHMHHSLNYRSVVVFGTGRRVTNPQEKDRGLAAVVEHLVPGRWEGARRPNDAERRATELVAVDMEEASAKIRSGPPHDDDQDLDLPYWAGVIPVGLMASPPVPDGDRPMPEHVREWAPGCRSSRGRST